MLIQIRTKKLGLLIFDARKASRRSIEECAEAIKVPPEQFQQYEQGQKAPSLPELELLALLFNIPVEHFWGKHALSNPLDPAALEERERLVMLRNRVIGTNLRLARNKAGLSAEELTARTSILEDQINQIELGTRPASVPELELLADLLGLQIEQFYDQHGPIGKWRAQQGAVQKFLELQPELQQFVCKPVNRPYLELAMRLSELSAEKLRAVAEVLLEITY